MTHLQNRLFKGQKQLFSIGLKINLDFIVAVIVKIHGLLLNSRRSNNIRENACCRHVRARARTFDNER